MAANRSGVFWLCFTFAIVLFGWLDYWHHTGLILPPVLLVVGAAAFSTWAAGHGKESHASGVNMFVFVAILVMIEVGR